MPGPQGRCLEGDGGARRAFPFYENHGFAGFSIRISPSSTVSPGFAVNSLRSCMPGGLPTVDRSTN